MRVIPVQRCHPRIRQQGPAGAGWPGTHSTDACPQDPDDTDTGGGGGGDRSTVTTLSLAQRARARLPVPAPAIHTAPPRDTNALVRMPHWFWLAHTQWASRSATARLGELSATVAARATSLTINPGDGTEAFTCTPPWTPYTHGATSSCTHTFTHHGRYTATITVHWTASWTGSDGDGGTLPALSATTTFPIKVVQAHSQLIADP
ncbi:MAG: hypothetical protein ACRDO8_14175 [Nocardioidaceae bacterium]